MPVPGQNGYEKSTPKDAFNNKLLHRNILRSNNQALREGFLGEGACSSGS